LVGNVDEGLAAYVLYSSIEYLRGRPIGLFRGWHSGRLDNNENNKR
jgi:hypothetical protein